MNRPRSPIGGQVVATIQVGASCGARDAYSDNNPAASGTSIALKGIGPCTKTTSNIIGLEPFTTRATANGRDHMRI